jgi:hypothetical protein
MTPKRPLLKRGTGGLKVEKHEYDAIQKALDDHLNRVMKHSRFNRQERNAYEKAVMACKSILSKNCIKEWENENA